MSVEIEYCDTCVTKEEIVKKSEQLKTWIEQALKEQWNPMAYSNKEIEVFDQPTRDGKTYVMSKTIFQCNAEKTYNYIKTITEENQKKYETGLMCFERDQRFEEEQCETTRNMYKSPWPVAPREFVNCQNWYEKDGSFYFLQESINYPKKWNEVNKSFVRGYKKSALVLKPIDENKCEATRIIILDARGSVPNYLSIIVKKDDSVRLFEMKKFMEQVNK